MHCVPVCLPCPSEHESINLAEASGIQNETNQVTQSNEALPWASQFWEKEEELLHITSVDRGIVTYGMPDERNALVCDVQEERLAGTEVQSRWQSNNNATNFAPNTLQAWHPLYASYSVADGDQHLRVRSQHFVHTTEPVQQCTYGPASAQHTLFPMTPSTMVRTTDGPVAKSTTKAQPSVWSLPGYPPSRRLNVHGVGASERTQRTMKNILPSSARKSDGEVILVFGRTVPRWLVDKLQETNAIPNIRRHRRNPVTIRPAISRLLRQSEAVWDLTTLEIPWESSGCPPKVQVRGYVAHVDLVLNDELSFKLTKSTIDTLYESFASLGADKESGGEDETAFRAFFDGYAPTVNAAALLSVRKDGSGQLRRQHADHVAEMMGKKLRQVVAQPTL